MSEFNYRKALLHLKENKTEKSLVKEGFNTSALSPDEQQQLKEYISSLKEIKKSINELLKKGKVLENIKKK